MKKLLQYSDELPIFSASGVGINSDPLIPQGLKFYSKGSGKSNGIQRAHAHGKYIFRYQLSGEACFNVDGTNFNMSAGDAILIPPGTRHYLASSADEQQVLCAAFELPPKELRLRRVCKHLFQISPRNQKLLVSAVGAFISWLNGNAASAGEAAMFFACFLHRIQHLDIQENIDISLDNTQNSLVGKIVEYLAANRDHRVTLKELAHVMHVSGSTIRQTFHAKMGRSIGAYELSRRLIYSTELLRSTDLSVHEVATQCGFSSANGLYRALKRAKCDGPAKMRKRIKKQ